MKEIINKIEFISLINAKPIMNEKEKEREIILLIKELEKQTIDDLTDLQINLYIKKIKGFAISNSGLLNNENRAKIYNFYMILLKNKSENKRILRLLNNLVDSETQIKSKNDCKRVISVDCDRSVINQYNESNINKEEKLEYIEKLKSILLELNDKKFFSYYQGFHDISFYLILVFKQDLAKLTDFLYQLCFFKLHDFSLEYLNEKYDFVQVMKIFDYIFQELYPHYHSKIQEISQDGFYYVSSFIFTWFTHDINNIPLLMRIFDYLILSNPLIIYFLSAKILGNYIEKNNLLQSADDKIDSEEEYFDYFKSLLIIKSINESNIESLIIQTDESFKSFNFTKFHASLSSKKLNFLPFSPNLKKNRVKKTSTRILFYLGILILVILYFLSIFHNIKILDLDLVLFSPNI